jgi:hypothetical protein
MSVSSRMKTFHNTSLGDQTDDTLLAYSDTDPQALALDASSKVASAASSSAAALTDVLYLTEPGNASAISITDINQCTLGDCYLLSSIGELALWTPSTIANMIRDNGNGTYTVTLYENSNGSLINLGAQAPVTSFKAVQETVSTAFDPRSVNSFNDPDIVNGQQEIWVQVLEEAVAQLYTPARDPISAGYTLIGGGGQPIDAMEVLTGRSASFSGANLTAAQLMAYQAVGALVVYGTPEGDDAQLDLIGGHAYAFESITMVNNTPMVQLYNPWGRGYYNAQHVEIFTPAAGFLPDQPSPITLSALESYADSVSVSTQIGVSVAASGMINVANATAVTLNGNHLQLSGGQSDTVTVNGSGGDTLSLGQNATVTVAANEAGNSFNATMGKFSLGNGNFATFTGAENTIAGGSGEYWTISGNSNNAELYSGQVTVTGNSDFVQISSMVAGSTNALTVTGKGDSLTASYTPISFSAGISGTVQGDWNNITASTGDSPVLEGSHNSLTIGSNSIVSLTGIDNTVLASNDSITMYANATAYFGGSADTITSSSGDNTFGFMGTLGNMTIKDFSTLASAHDVIDIYGISSLSNFSSVISHTTQVGTSAVISNGGSSLTLAGVNKASLTASDFMFSYLGPSAVSS